MMRSYLLAPAISAAILLSLLPLTAITTSSPITMTVVLVIGIPAVIGMVCTALRLPHGWSVFLSLGGGLVAWAWQGVALSPSPDPGSAWGTLWHDGITELAGASLPLTLTPALTWLLAGCTLLLWWVATLLVDTLEQPAWAIAPLVLPYAIPAMLAPTDLPLSTFLTTAGAYLLLLVCAPQSHHRPGDASFEISRWFVGLAMGAVAILISLAATSVMPMGTKQPWLAAGPNTPIQLSDPTVDLTNNLNRPEPIDVLTYRASDGQAHYLRATALTKLTSQGAQLTSMRLAPSGLEAAYDAPGTPIEVNVSMRFPSQYLPTPFAPDRWEAAGDWGFDRNTLSIVGTGASGPQQTTALDYRVFATLPVSDDATISQATAGTDPAGPETLEIPGELDPGVTSLVATITANATTDGDKALAIERFLTSDDFTYTLDAPQTADSDVISDFLLNSRQGYCVHYATAMTAMSRMVGIPARVAVGFTGGAQQGDGYLVTTDNMHAWPELYFDGLGWVPFEPTKGFNASPEPVSPAAPEPSPSPADEPTAAPSPAPEPSAQPSQPTPSPTATQSESRPPDLTGVIRSLALVLTVIAVVLLPAALRWLLAWLRLRPQRAVLTMADDAWRELAATSIDLGLPWEGGSPVIAARIIGESWTQPTGQRLIQLAETVQRARYAKHPPDVMHLAAQVRQLKGEMFAQATPARRVRAVLLPTSLWALSRRLGHSTRKES